MLISIAIAFLWVINISVNMMQGPSRAIIADLLPADSQQLGNAILTASTGMFPYNKSYLVHISLSCRFF